MEPVDCSADEVIASNRRALSNAQATLGKVLAENGPYELHLKERWLVNRGTALSSLRCGLKGHFAIDVAALTRNDIVTAIGELRLVVVLGIEADSQFAAFGFNRGVPATLHDRSAPVIDLKRRLRSEKVDNFRLDRTAHLDVLARKEVRWAADKAEQIRNTNPELPASLFNRDADNWRPLLTIAEVAGGKWPAAGRHPRRVCCQAGRCEHVA